MAQTRNITRNWFISSVRYAHRGWPWIETGTTNEIEPPYRGGSSLVVRLPFTRVALVVGRWGPPRSEQEGLLAAIGGQMRDLDGLGDIR